MVDLGGEWAKTSFIGLHFSCQRDSEQAATVKRPTKSDDAPTTGSRACDLDRVFNSLSAGRKECYFLGSIYRTDFQNTLRKMDIFGVRHHLVATMGKPCQLSGNGCLDFGMAMARIEYRNATSKVDETTAFDIPELRILGVVNKEIPHHGNATRCCGQAAGVPIGIGLGGRRLHRCVHFHFLVK